MGAGCHPCPQLRVLEGGSRDLHRRTGDLGVMYRADLVPSDPGALVPDPPPASDADANLHSQARSNRLRLAETNRVPATLVHSPRNAIHGRVSGLLGFYKLLKI